MKQQEESGARRRTIGSLAFAAALALAGGLLAGPARAVAPLTAEEVVEKGVAAHGGLEAWNKIDSLLWVGHIESDQLTEKTVRFSLEEKRPGKERFDILSGQPSVRIFNGSKGWKVRSRQDGMPDVDTFSPLEERFAREAPGLGGPLIAYRQQNRRFVLLGVEALEGRDCYRLGVSLPSGGQQVVWVDAETFLETRFDRPSYSRDGKVGTVSVYYRNYQSQGGLQIPTVQEIGSSGATSSRLVIERMALNPDIKEARFARPPSPPHSREITIPASPPSPMGSAPQ